MVDGVSRQTRRTRATAPRSASWTMAAVTCLVMVGWVQPADAVCPPAVDLDAAIEAAEQSVVTARAYLGNYPDGNNDPNPVRRRFLRVGDDDRPGDEPARGHDLRVAVDKLVELSRCAKDPVDRTRIDELLNQAVQLALQGWVVSGNISLMEGLRISYPRASGNGNQARPQHNPIPYGSLENEDEFSFLSIKDATRSALFYDEGIRVLLASLRRRPPSAAAPVIMDVDTRPVPAEDRGLPGYFENNRFPQYTYYVDEGDPELPDDDRIVPIRTQGHLMGQLLQNAGQATQSIGYRLWTAAYFNDQTRDPEARETLLNAAVNQSRAGAHTQFLSSLALAATMGHEAVETPQTPYDTSQIHQTRRSVDSARATIARIRADERPTLPIAAILAGDEQIRPLITSIEDGIERARESYDAATNAMFRVYENAVRMFDDEQSRENQFINRLRELTGVPADAGDLRTVAGQRRYMERVSTRLDALLTDSGFVDVGANSTNALDRAIQRVVLQRQQVENRQQDVDFYPERIRILEEQLGENRSAIADAEGKVTATRVAVGKANRHRTTVTAGVSKRIGTTLGVTISAGVNHTYDWEAVARAELQADIDRATYTKELRFLEHGVAAQIRNLMLDQDRALGELRSQVILLRQAEDDANRVLADVRLLLQRLRAYDEGAEDLWYRDPAWTIELTAEEERANRDILTLIENLYRLGGLLEFRWREPFANPVPVTDGEAVSLGQDFENFWSLESVFALPSVNVRDRGVNAPHEQAAAFYRALKAWDATLANQRFFEGDTRTIEISLREDVFGLADVKTADGRTVTLRCQSPDSIEDCERRSDNRRRFQNILINNGLFVNPLDSSAGPAKPTGFLLRFPLRYTMTDRFGVDRLFGDTGAWNHRVAGIEAKIVPVEGQDVIDSDVSGREELDVIFAQGGLSEYVDFFERSKAPEDVAFRSINLDAYVRYGRDLRRLGNAPFLRTSSLPARNRYPSEVGADGRLRPTADMAGAFWSPFATRWYFQVHPVNGLQIEHIDDIMIRMRLVTGRPGCLPGWEHCGDRRQ